MPSFNDLARETQARASSFGTQIGRGLQGIGDFFFGDPTRPTFKPGSRGGRPTYTGSPAPGAPGAGGAQYVSPFQGRRDANIGLLRSRGYGIPSAAIVTGLDRGGNIDRTQSDQYRAAMGQQAPVYPSFPLTPQGQFERYFSSGSPEMDRYFGAASRGTGAPKSLEEMNTLASQSRAPMTSPLATYYRAQSAAGRGNMDEIISGLGYTGAMAEWAKANPMLAQRAYNKKFPAGSGVPTTGPSDLAMLKAAQAGQYYPAEGSPMPDVFRQGLTTGPSNDEMLAAYQNKSYYMPDQGPTPPEFRPGANPVPAPPAVSGTQPSPDVKSQQSAFTRGTFGSISPFLVEPASSRASKFIDLVNRSRNFGTTENMFGA